MYPDTPRNAASEHCPIPLVAVDLAAHAHLEHVQLSAAIRPERVAARPDCPRDCRLAARSFKAVPTHPFWQRSTQQSQLVADWSPASARSHISRPSVIGLHTVFQMAGCSLSGLRDRGWNVLLHSPLDRGAAFASADCTLHQVEEQTRAFAAPRDALSDTAGSRARA